MSALVAVRMPLTSRQSEILAIMADGRSNGAIARFYSISERTVENHVAQIFEKLGLQAHEDDHRRVLAVLWYLTQETL